MDNAAKRIKLSVEQHHLTLKQAFGSISDTDLFEPALVRRAWDRVVELKWLVDDVHRLGVNLKALGAVADSFIEHQTAIREGLEHKLTAAKSEHAEVRRTFLRGAAFARSEQAQPALKVLNDFAFEIGRGLPQRVFPLGPDGAMHCKGSSALRWEVPEDGWLNFETIAMLLYMMPHTSQRTLDKVMDGARAAGVEWLVNAPSLTPDVLKKTHPHFAEVLKASVPPTNVTDYDAHLAARKAFEELKTLFNTVFDQDDYQASSASARLINLGSPEDVWHGIVCSYHDVKHTNVYRNLTMDEEDVIHQHRPADVDCIRIEVEQHGLPSDAGDDIIVGGHRTVHLRVFFAQGRYVATVSRTVKSTGFARPSLRDSFFGGCLRRCEITLEEAARGSTIARTDGGAPHLMLYVKDGLPRTLAAAAAAAAGV